MADLNDATNDFPYTQYPEVEPLTKAVCDIGDVLLIADDGSHPPLRIQASSVLLSTVSKVFRTLFRGSFAEGEAMRNATDSLVEIRVSDAPSDILLLCQPLHFQGDLNNVRGERFLDLALVIDKYDCAQALRHATTNKFAALELESLGALILPSQETEVDSDGDLMYGRGSWGSPLPKPPSKLVKPPTKFELVHIVERIELLCVGLCLDCLKGNHECRVKHADPFDKYLWYSHGHMGLSGGSEHGKDTKRPVDWESIW